ncbi:hypothetical protein AAF712_016478 [Marasmius tenuissimus]|uniref:Retrovirus-related Pol polyprotein from transposon TNT 1-94-like beta-barrel domain-containing protein n=1 Tax=Marasmius tenuissimus TaxID=585030 RepID=A0ABR2Z8U6_9AGAR
MGHLKEVTPEGESITDLLLCLIVAPPHLTALSSIEEIKEYSHYIANDSVVLQILLLRVNNEICLSLPGAVDVGGCCSARDWYLAGRTQYGLGNHTKVITAQMALFVTSAQNLSKVPAYVENYQSRTLAISRATREMDWKECIYHFRMGLPIHNKLVVIRDNIIHKLTQGQLTRTTFKKAVAMVNERMSTSKQRTADNLPKDQQDANRKSCPRRTKCQGCNRWWNAGTTDCSCGQKLLTTGNDRTASMATPASTTAAGTPARATNANKPTVAAVVTETNAIVDSAYVACTIFSEPSSSMECSPLIDLEKEGPAAYRDICQTYHTVLDSAATRHVICDKSLFVQFDPSSEEMVSTGVAGDVVVKGSGICCFEMKLQGSSTVLHLWMPNCLYSPNAPFNLMSGVH